MNTLDLLIIAVVATLATLGFMQGFIVGAASLGGVVLGGVVGTRASRFLLDQIDASAAVSTWAPLFGLLVGLLITVVGALAMQDIGSLIRGRVRSGEHVALDHVLGAVLLAAVAMLLTWFAAAAAIGVPQLRPLRPQIVQSNVVQLLNATLPPAGPILGAVASFDPFPEFDGGRIDVSPPDVNTPRDPEVRQVLQSVVRVVGSACGYRVTGSGWVAADGYVITNAHVVAGESDTGIQVGGGGATVGASVVTFDPVNDVAVLRVSTRGMQPLATIGLKPAPGGTDAAIIGYPENLGRTTSPARFSDERDVRADDIYGGGPVQRRVSSFRGLVRHGNSGGPVVNADGRVISTVFATTVGKQQAGGYGVPNSITAAALARAQRVPDGFHVRTGKCIA